MRHRRGKGVGFVRRDNGMNGAQFFEATTPENLVDPKLAQSGHSDLVCHLRRVFRTTKSNEVGF